MAEEMDIDPDIAAQMGFASFGNQPKAKKRKVDATDSAETTIAQVSNTTTEKKATTHEAMKTFPRPRNPATESSSDSDMKALRQGVRDERGDVAYYLPSFIEDPWKHLRDRKVAGS